MEQHEPVRARGWFAKHNLSPENLKIDEQAPSRSTEQGVVWPVFSAKNFHDLAQPLAKLLFLRGDFYQDRGGNPRISPWVFLVGKIVAEKQVGRMY